MARWSLVFKKTAEEDLATFDLAVRRRIIKRLEFFVENFDRVVPMPLTAEFRGFYKLRIGDWRVIYRIDRPQNMIVVVYIAHRREVYKL